MRVFQRFESSIFRKTNIRRGLQNADKTIKTYKGMTKEQLEKANFLKQGLIIQLNLEYVKHLKYI